jgi:hypothetical protein
VSLGQWSPRGDLGLYLSLGSFQGRWELDVLWLLSSSSSNLGEVLESPFAVEDPECIFPSEGWWSSAGGQRRTLRGGGGPWRD